MCRLLLIVACLVCLRPGAAVDLADPGLPDRVAALDAAGVRTWLLDSGWLVVGERGDAARYGRLAAASDALIAALRERVAADQAFVRFALDATGLSLERAAERNAYRARLQRAGRLVEAIRLCAGMAGKVAIGTGDRFGPEEVAAVRRSMLAGTPAPAAATAAQRAQLTRIRLYAAAAHGIAGLSASDADLLLRAMGGYSPTTYDQDGMRELRPEAFAHLDATCRDALAAALDAGGFRERGSAAQLRRMSVIDP
jgi:hypothetical protein